MPGHVKLGKAGEADPDPLPYLVVTLEMKRADMLRPYDSKKSYWCPEENMDLLNAWSRVTTVPRQLLWWATR